jgi:hypothetical protein
MNTNHDWLNLIEVSGPFLAVPVLREVLPQGLEALTSGRPQRLRAAYDEWRDAVDADDADLPAIHAAWIDEVLQSALEVDDQVLRRAATLPERLKVLLPEHGVSIAPDLAIVNPTHGDAPLLLVQLYDPDTDLDATRNYDGLATTPGDRMVALLRAVGCPVGLVTNGERWMLVHAPAGAVASFASWYARLWGREPETLRAFVSLVGVRRFFGPEAERLPAIFERSLKHQDDVTDALGEQVRRAVEVLVQSLDRADQDRNRDLLHDVDPKELYEAGLTVMMRLVFLLAAEERGLLLLGDPRYDAFYALSSLRMQLRADTEEILERRRSAWSRLLALFRGVYGGIDHPLLRLPAMGGSLFDPDRYPFLEGRKTGTNWRSDPAEPLPIDDRTVLLLLEAIQTFEGRTLSYRALDVEQIGHVYEGLLERTVQRVDDVTLELEGSVKAKNARVALGEIESARLDCAGRIVDLLKERSERSEPAIRNAIGREADERVAARLLTVCRGDVALRDRILPYAELLRTDPWGYPLVHHAGAFVVVLGADRRESGTHYTPKSLTEKIVEETLTPIVYRGPAEGAARADWKLKTADELLDLKVCDPAMGSGAFLVQACRWLADRLVEAWSDMEAAGSRIDDEGRIRAADDTAGFEPLSRDTEVRAILARRLIAERCLYGVDKNPLAVELAKLSLWLTTLAKGRPVGFLDHNLRSGDSLLGIHDLDQLIELDMSPKGKAQLRLFGGAIRSAVDKALALRSQLRSIPIRDISDVDAMAALDAQSRSELALPELIADGLVGIVLADDRAVRITALATMADEAAGGDADAQTRLLRQGNVDLASDTSDGVPRRPLHWPLEFPEVFAREVCGFDAIIGNPPFLGNRLWKSSLGERFQLQCQMILREPPGKIDLSVVFLRRASDLLRDRGCFGLLGATNIAEGSAVDVGLGKLVNAGTIYFARKGMPWPGSANINVAVVCFAKGGWEADANCEGIICQRIGARLVPEKQSTWQPVPLKSAPFSFEGVNNSKGLAFLLSTDQPWHDILSAESQNLVRPYISGDDITASALTRVSRYALDISDLSFEEIESRWPAAAKFLLEVVKPTRSANELSSYKGLIDRWWQFWNNRADLMRKVRRNECVITYSKNTKYTIGILAPSNWIYTNKVLIIDQHRRDLYAICLSSMFQDWLRRFSGGNLSNLGATVTLSINESVAKFPLPTAALSDASCALATRFNDQLISFCRSQNSGLTDAMNQVHDRTYNGPEISSLRTLLAEIDRAVVKVYGWDSEQIKYDFHEIHTGSNAVLCRWSIPKSFAEILFERLLELNEKRHGEEMLSVRPGAGSPRVGRASRRQKWANSTPAASLDLQDIFSTIEDGK